MVDKYETIVWNVWKMIDQTNVFPQGASGNAENQELRMRLLMAGKHCSTHYQQLLETISMVTTPYTHAISI